LTLANEDSAGYGTGRRKTAIARVRLLPGEGRITINEKPALQYLGRRTLELVVMTPFRVVDTKRFDASVKVIGGGKSGQAGAVAHGVARALLANDPELRPILKKAGLLTRDSREKERKKPGLKRARKAPQYTKR
jgi:small subunit ribosomal protein S9